MAMAVGIANLVGSCHIVSEKCSMPKLCVDVQAAQQCGGLRRKRRSVCVVASSSSSSAAGESEESWVRSGAVAIGAAAMVLLATGGAPAAMAVAEGGDVAPFQTYYGTAASASSYGGYGGNANKKDSAEYIFDVPQVAEGIDCMGYSGNANKDSMEYIFDVPQGWKERNISKVEKGTNGTDSEFYNPKKKEEKTYLTYLAGFRKLGPRDNVLQNLALSDVNLQDIIGLADDIKAEDKTENGQLYYVFEIDSPVAHELIKVTCAKNKLYSHFVKAPASDWARDKEMLRHLHDSFQTIGDPVPIS